MKLSPEVKKEVRRVAAASAVCCAVTVLICALLEKLVPDIDFFSWRTVLSVVLGTFIAVGNFCMLAITVRDASKVYDKEEEGKAKAVLQVSFRRRALIMLAWGICTLVLPCFNAAGLIPLLFPSTIIKVLALKQAIDSRKG